MSAERVHGVTKDQRPSGEAVLVSMISSALNGVKQGKTREYDTLIQMLADPELKDVQLRRCLHALKSCYSCLTKEYDMLVGTVLNTRWATCDQDTVEEFIEFLSCLLSAQTFYLRACLHMIVKLFLPAGRSKDMDPNSVDHEALEQIFANGHEALQAVSEIVPTVPQFLTPVLSANFPYMGKPTIFLESYVKNLLEITKYLPGLRPKILELITYHLIKIDVEIPKHELEHDQKELDDEDEEHGQLEVDMDTAKHETEGTENDKEEQQMEHEMANKLDTLMLLLFEYITDITHTNGEYNIDGGTELFNTLLVVFEDVILPTHASCHVQFIMFHLSSLDLVFANSLLDLWWGKIKDPNMPGIIRQASAAYVASFASRAKFIPISAVQTCLNLISHWIHCYIDLHDADCPGPDANKHGPFYSVCQALFYIFIFRHKQLMELEGGLKYIRRLNLERIVSCRLNPLKVCLPTVVRLFAQVTRQHELVFCYTIIERNNRMMLPVATSTSSRAVSSLTLTNQLDSFFPFDPYLLRRSAKYITPFYQEWEGLEHNEEEYEDVQHSEAEDESEDNLDYLENPDATVPGFTPDTPMCVAPGFVSSPATC